jgi:hypothetical protein
LSLMFGASGHVSDNGLLAPSDAQCSKRFC